jgi:K+-sensing histidine kinase KdpD
MNNSVKNDFMGIITHELRTPLTSLKAFAQFLYERAEKSGDNTSATYLLKMATQINKLNVLVQELLNVTRISSGKMKFNNEQFNMNELILEILIKCK